MRQVTINKQLLPLKGHYFLWNAGTGPVVPFLSSYARQLGFSSVIVGFIYTILPISGMLAKPIFGSIGDRFRCQKVLFLAAQLLTAAAFLSIFYTPQVETERTVRFLCDDNLPRFHTIQGDTALDSCTMAEMKKETHVEECSLKCNMTDDATRNLLCINWKLEEYCERNTTHTTSSFSFTALVPKSEIFLHQDSTLSLKVTGISTTLGAVTETCPTGTNVSTLCHIRCNDYSINDVIAVPAVDDKDVYGLYEFWCFLTMMVVGWVGQAIAVSIGDAICFEMLGDKPNRYGNQRLFGALGWGLSSAFVGFLIDFLSKGKSQKDYTCAFYISAAFFVLDFIVSSRLQYSQKNISANIVKDVGKLLYNVHTVVFLLWCISVGMCTGLIWQFLFWLVEDLASAQGCESYNNVKTLEGIIQAIQCLCGEIPFFFFSGWIIKKLGHVNTMSLVLFAIGIRFTLYSVISNPWWFLPIEVMNGLTFGLFFACMASYASIIAPPGTEATMQGLVGAVFEGVGVSAGSALAGFLYEQVSGPLTFRYFGFGAFIVGVLHVVVQYLLKFKDTIAEYSPPDAALEKKQDEDQRELTYVDL